MAHVRPPAVAGTFYPGDPRELRAMVTRLLGAAVPAPPGAAPKALIVPHAGYRASGPVAASAYALLAPARRRVRRVVLVGPSHRVAVPGVALSGAARFATPLGEVPVDTEAPASLADLPQVGVMDAVHAREHSLEVQLPFLQVVLEDFTLVPLLVHDAGPQEVGEVLERLWGGAETLVVASSDLSHYHDGATARRLDEATAGAIEALRDGDIGEEDACGAAGVRGLLWAARRRGLRARTVDLRNSGDIVGPRDEVVGYGAFALD